MEAIYEFDYSVINFIYENLHSDFADGFFSLITHLGDAGLFWIALAAVLLVFKRTRRAGAAMGLALIFGVLVGNAFLKPLIARIRPYDNLAFDPLVKSAADLLIKAPSDFSFPSGHTLASFEGAGAIFCWNRKWGIPALILAALIAFSRLYLYVHYFTDVLAGMLLGLGFAVAAYYIVKRAEPGVIEFFRKRKKTSQDA